MKKLLALILLISAFAYAADTYTTRMGLTKPEESSTNWGPKLRANYDIIDSSAAILTANQTFTGTNIFSGAVTISTMTPNQVLIATSTYPGSQKLVVNGDAKFFGTTGGVISLCDQNGLNCSNMSLETANPTKGTVFSSNLTVTDHVGIGASPLTNTALRISTATSSASNRWGQYTTFSNSSGTLGLTRSVGIQSDASFTSTSNGSGARLYAIDTSANSESFGTISSVTGVRGNAGSTSTGTVTNIYGVEATPFRNGGGTSTSIYGFYTGMNLSSGAVTTNNYGVYVASPIITVGGGGTITNNYGIYLAEQRVGTSTSYGVYQVGASSNVFTGHVAGSSATFTGFIQAASKTAAQIRALTPNTTQSGLAQYYYCSDCSAVSTCVSTGTAVGAWALITNKGSVCQ